MTIPTTLPQALFFLVKRMIWRAIAPHRVMFLVTLTFVVALVHTYLLVVVNEGFNLSNPWMSEALVLPSQFLRGAAQFALAGYLTAVILRRWIRHPVAFPQQITGIPTTLANAVEQASFTALALLPLGASVGFGAGALLARRTLQFEIAIALFLTISLGGGLLLVLTRLLTQDLLKLLGGEPLEVRPEWLLLPMAGAAAGLLLSTFFPLMPWSGLAIAGQAFILAVVGAAVAYSRRPDAAIALLVLGILVASGSALADDGGWVEAGGSFDRWIWSPGAWTSIGIGFVPGIGFSGGWLIGIVTGEFDPEEWGLVPVDPDAEQEEEEEDVEDLTVTLRIERNQPGSPKVLTDGFRYRAVIDITGGEDEPEVSAAHWSGSPGVEFGAETTALNQWNAVEMWPGPFSLTVEVEVNGETYQAHRGDVAKDHTQYARVGSIAKVEADAHGCPACPHTCQGPIILGSPTFFIGGQPAARVGDPGIHAACCGPNMWTVASGDPEILIDGKPAAKIDSATTHCGGTGKIISH